MGNCMAKNEPITYQSVAKICNEMLNANVKPSVRQIHSRLGGSFSTLSEHLSQWRAQKTLIQSSDNELSEEFNQALLAEFARITANSKNQSSALLNEKDEQLIEVRELLSECETKLVECEENFKAEKEQARAGQLALEKKLAAAESEAKSTKQREIILQEKIDGLIEKCHQAELRAAVAETKVVEQSKRELNIDKKSIK